MKKELTIELSLNGFVGCGKPDSFPFRLFSWMFFECWKCS